MTPEVANTLLELRELLRTARELVAELHGLALASMAPREKAISKADLEQALEDTGRHFVPSDRVKRVAKEWVGDATLKLLGIVVTALVLVAVGLLIGHELPR